MPYSEDEFDQPNMQESQVSTMTKAELRKTHKPMMEKRRRARINSFLNEIKNLILEAMNKDPARHTKLEKADILEMAVKHLQNVQRQQLAIAMATDPSVVRKFKTGFNECASEIDKFLGKSDNIEKSVHDRVLNHLNKCINGLEHANQFSLSTPSNISVLPTSNIYTSNTNQESGDQNNNPRLQIPQGIQLIPSRLPSGELALLVPNSSNLSYFSSPSLTQRPSAFVTVTSQSTESTESASPLKSPVKSSAESPKGFRPVHSHLVRPKAGYLVEDHQVPQITSTVDQSGERQQFSVPMEVKTMRFPIHKTLEKEKKTVEHISVIKKVSEPLCIITNQGERYRHAQQKEDSLFLEENKIISRSIKRGYGEVNQGILATVSQESRPNKLIKTSHHVVPPSTHISHSPELQQSLFSAKQELKSTTRRNLDFAYVHEESKNLANERNEHQGHEDERNVESNDMWRPW